MIKNKTKRKIAVLTSNLAIGGAEGVAVKVAEAINRLDGCTCELIVLNNKIVYETDVPIQIINAGYMSYFPVMNLVNKGLYHFGLYVWKLKRLKREKGYDTVISFTSLPNILNVASGIGEKRILSLRNFYSREASVTKKTLLKRLEKAYKCGDHIVTTSKDSRRDLIQTLHIPEERVTAIYNPYRIDVIKKDKRSNLSKEETKDTINLLAAGRITEQKAFWRAIKALHLLRDQFPNVHLSIAGQSDRDKEMKEQLKQLVKRYKLEERVHFLGFRKDIKSLMQASDVFLLTSKWEGFPNVLVEAMINGLSVVAVNCPSGPGEIIGNDKKIIYNEEHFCVMPSGILVDTRSEESFTEDILPIDISISKALRFMINNSEYKKEALESARLRSEDFSVEAIIEEWKNII